MLEQESLEKIQEMGWHDGTHGLAMHFPYTRGVFPDLEDAYDMAYVEGLAMPYRWLELGEFDP
jgi:hypothetical protein